MKSESLTVTDDYSAKGATAPRVSLQSMQDKIIDENYLNLGEALFGNDEGIERNHPTYLLTLCVITMENGFTVIGKSAPASAANFDAEKGKTFAYEDAIRQLWPLEGYALRERLFHDGAG